jgi:hypothetical protein
MWQHVREMACVLFVGEWTIYKKLIFGIEVRPQAGTGKELGSTLVHVSTYL